jgi:hypothetical protein
MVKPRYAVVEAPSVLEAGLADALNQRTERAHRMSLNKRRRARHIGTYALVVLDIQNAGYGASNRVSEPAVMCARVVGIDCSRSGWL